MANEKNGNGSEEIKRAASPEKNEAVQVLAFTNVNFEHPLPDVHVARIMIANASWVDTSEGAVLIDTLLNPPQAQKMRDAILENGGPIKYIIYTHGHADHIGGSNAFSGDKPEVIAQSLLPERVEKYNLLGQHNARIAIIQFNIPFLPERKITYLEPTRTFDESMTFSVGDKTFELYHERAETDDATWVYVPEIKTAFVGDLIIAGFPNIGNPFKPTRFSLPWARALEKVRDKNPEMIIAHGGRAVYLGADVKNVLDVTVEAIHSIHDQVIEHINNDVPIDEMIHMVKLPDHLKDHNNLRFLYSRPEFAVYNIYRWYHGYFDHNPAHLLPRPDKEVNEQIFDLIGDAGKIMARSNELLESGRAQLAIQVLDVLLKHDPDNKEARQLHLKIIEVLCKEDYCLMSRNTWVHFMEKDREFLGLKG